MTMQLIVIGAGPAGLAYSLGRICDDPTLSISILEASAQYGGHVQTKHVDGFTLELGPQAIRPNRDFLQLTESLGLEDDLIPASPRTKRRWLAKNGRLIRFPNNLLQAIGSKIMPLRGKLRILREPWIQPTDQIDESVEAFVRRRLGSECASIIQAVINGIYAGDARELEARSCLRALTRAESEHGSLARAMFSKRRKVRGKHAPNTALYSFVGGMSKLTAAMARSLGKRLTTAEVVSSIKPCAAGWEVISQNGRRRTAREVVLATPAWASAEILKDHDPKLSKELEQISFAPVTSVYLGYRNSDMHHYQDGFGFLLHPNEASPALGAIYCSSIFPNQAPKNACLIRVMMGGQRHRDLIAAKDDEIAQKARRALQDYLGIEADPLLCHVTKIRKAIPQYSLGHAERLKTIESRLAHHQGLQLRGNSYQDIALGAQLTHHEPSQTVEDYDLKLSIRPAGSAIWVIRRP